ncbi:tetratricopeptide repeat protein [bacterium]|nr:tetratricopeptide repeat protein [bacterium]
MTKRLFAIVIGCAMLISLANAAAPNPMADVSPVALLRADQFDKLEEYYAYYFKNYNPKVASSYEPVSEAFGKIYYSSDLQPHLDKWVAAKPTSHVARLSRGNFYISHAWDARGAGFANTVSREAWRLFEQRLTQADADLTSATQLNPNSPFPFTSMITIDMGASRGLKSAATHFIAARNIDPSFYPAYSSFINMNRPRWGGSHEIMRQFAQNNADKVPGSLLPLLWVDYHEEMADRMNEGKDWWKKPGNWEQVDAIFKKLIPLEKEPNWLRTRYAINAHKAGHLDVLRQQLDLIGTNWAHWLVTSEYLFYYVHEAWPDQKAAEWVVRKANAELQKNPRSAQSLKMRGMAKMHLGHSDEALPDLKAALQIDGSMANCWRTLAQIYAGQKQYAQAIDAAEHFLLTEGYNEDLITLKGSALRDMGRHDDAIAYFESALKLHPALPQVDYALARAYLDKKDYQKAVAFGTEGLDWAEQFERKTGLRDMNWAVGTGYAELKQPDNAFKYYVEALKVEDEDFMLQVLAAIYHNGDIWVPYRERIVKAVEDNYRGYAKNQAKHDNALAEFKRKIAEPVAGQPVQNRTAANPAAAKRVPAAIVEANQCYNSAWGCMKTQQYKKGIEYARRSIELRKQRPWAPAYSQLGTLLMIDGQNDEALKAFNEALKIDPKDKMALSAMPRLKPAVKK